MEVNVLADWEPGSPRLVAGTRSEVIERVRRSAEQNDLAVSGDGNPTISMKCKTNPFFGHYHPPSIELNLKGEDEVSVEYQILAHSIWVIRFCVLVMAVTFFFFFDFELLVVGMASLIFASVWLSSEFMYNLEKGKLESAMRGVFGSTPEE